MSPMPSSTCARRGPATSPAPRSASTAAIPSATSRSIRTRSDRGSGGVLERSRLRRGPRAVPHSSESTEPAMMVNIRALEPLVALAAGVLILLAPRLLNYIVALYLILIGLSGLAPHL